MFDMLETLAFISGGLIGVHIGASYCEQIVRFRSHVWHYLVGGGGKHAKHTHN
jgi:hypothetical protein